MSYALLFSGQGSQHPDMLPWLESEPACAGILGLMGAQIGTDWRVRLRDTQQRSQNSFAQVLITGTTLAAWNAIKNRINTHPAVVAGYSVGELPAFACAGVITFEQALTLAAERAGLMDLSVAGLKTGLLSVSGLPEAAISAACAGLHIECAIRVNTMQFIFAGTNDDLSLATLTLQAIGAVCKRLAVQLASHSSWMTCAADAFAASLLQQPFARPDCAVALNASGILSRQPIVLREALSRQIASTVQWSACMDAIAERQVTCVLEIGAGSALARMWNERYPDIKARSLDDFKHLQGALDWIAKHAEA